MKSGWQKYKEKYPEKASQLQKKHNSGELSKAAQKRYRERHPDRIKDSRKRYRDSEKGKESARAAARKWRATHPGYSKPWALKKHYGLTKSEHQAMLLGQGGLCAICKSPPNGQRAAAVLHVDHCHSSGKVRGLLCTNCNTLLGHAKDSPLILSAAVSYLQRQS